MKNNKQAFKILIIILAVFCLISFVAPFARTAVFQVAFVFGIISILCQAWALKRSELLGGNPRSKLYGVPIVRVGLMYMCMQIVLSIVEMACQSLIPMWIVILVNAIVLADAVISILLVEGVRDETVRQEERKVQNTSAMRDLQGMAASLAGQCGDEGLKADLQKLAEELRYSDPVSSEKTRELEEEMRSQLGELRQAVADGDVEAAKKLCGKLMGSLADRNRACAAGK